MCLKVKDKKLKVSTNKIEVFKVIRMNGYYRKMITPYRWKSVELGKIYHSKLELEPILGTVEIGIHSFKTLEDAQLECKTWNDSLPSSGLDYKYFITKCIIPKGAEYYMGKFEIRNAHNDLVSISESYASSVLKYVELIN